jgi:dolichyl-phosphate-mannose--protein O-mannosyl transferase
LEDLLILVPVVYVAILGIGHITTQYDSANFGTSQWIILGIVIVAALIGGYGVTMTRGPRWAGRFVFVVFVTASLAIFFYYLPIWLGTPITREGYYARMWYQGPGKWNWI